MGEGHLGWLWLPFHIRQPGRDVSVFQRVGEVDGDSAPLNN